MLKPTVLYKDVSFIRFLIKIEQNKIPGKKSSGNVVFLMIKIKGEKNFQEIEMQSKAQYEAGLIYEHNMKIQKNEEYQYFYKVNSDSENQYRQYKYDSNLENGVDEWNKIWIGYRFNHKKQILQQQSNQGNETFRVQKSSTNLFLENFLLIENTDMFRTFEDQMNMDMIDENNQQKERLVQRSNYLIFQFTDDFIYNQHKNSVQQKKKKDFDYQKEITKEIQFQQEKFELHKEIHSNYTNNLSHILEEIIQKSSQVSNEQIQILLNPIEIPGIIEDPAFEKCKQTLIIINNNLEDLKQIKQILNLR